LDNCERARPSATGTDLTPFAHELRGIIYSNLGRTVEAAEEFEQALDVKNPGPLLMDKYREACKKLMDV
jgi:Flp pilus assembly protein TadD